MTARSVIRFRSNRFSKSFSQFESMLSVMQPLLEEKFGKEGSRQFRQQSLTVFRAEVADKLPYIGGRSNPYDLYLQQTGMALALYRVIKAWGGSLETAGELIYRGMMKVIAKYPRFFLRAYGRWSNSKLAYPRMRRGASKSKQRKFPEDWVYEFVEGDGQSFDYGIDMLECGILKFLEQQGAPELTPYLCAVDYITYHAMGIELKRDETLAAGCQRCSFRFVVQGNPVRPGWPPAFPEQKHCPA